MTKSYVYYSSGDMAKKLNVTTQSIRRYCESGYIIYYARVSSKKTTIIIKIAN